MREGGREGGREVREGGKGGREVSEVVINSNSEVREV